MLHIFVSNAPGRVRYGTTGLPVPGYQVRLVDQQGEEVKPGDLGELLVSGPSAALQYWNNPEKTQLTFQTGWVRTGDTFCQTDAGDYVYCGRGDDMMKVSGLWVAPMEVESILLSHPAVLEAAVVGACDERGLIRAKAFVVLKGEDSTGALFEQELCEFARTQLPPYKCPRWVEVVSSLPKTATGKIQRHVLRQRSQ
jgi:acyl-coenzyme A synthetase/AMP-(fatty) acid ligase